MDDQQNVIVKRLEAHSDARGSLFEVYRMGDDGVGIRQVYFSTSKPGAVRGNHFHKRKTEGFVALSGKALVKMIDTVTGEVWDEVLAGDQPVLILVKPMIAHKVVALGSDPLTLLILVSEEFNPSDSDTFEFSMS